MLPPPLPAGFSMPLRLLPNRSRFRNRFGSTPRIRFDIEEEKGSRQEPAGASPAVAHKKGLPPEGSSPEKKGRNPKRPDQPCGTSSCWPSGSPSQPDEPEDTASALRIRFARSTVPIESGEGTSSVTEAKASVTFISPERRFLT